MRCPNCGNENPPDYLFCDECGARLIGNDVAAMSGTQDAGTDMDAGGGGGGDSAMSTQDQAGADMGGAANYGSYGMGADQSVQGDGMGDMGMSDANNGAAQMAADSADDETGMSAVPVTEDTMAGEGAGAAEAAPMPDVIRPLTPIASNADQDASMADQDVQAGASANDDAQESMSGPADDARMAVDEGMAEATGISGSAASISSMPDAGYTEDEAVAVPMGDVADESGLAGAAGSEWAAHALDLLNRAQDALSNADWRMFGEFMHNLKSSLQASAAGAASSAGAMPVAQPESEAPAMPMSADSDMSGTQAQDMGGASPSAGMASDAGADSTMMSGSPSSMAMDGGAPSAPATYEAPPVAPMSSTADSMDSGMQATSMDAGMSTASAPSEAMMNAAPTSPPPTVTPMASTPPQPAPAPSGARLILISTGAEMALPDQEEITVGREDPSSGIFPDVDLTPYGGEDGGVSRRHSRLLHIGDDYFVEDLQSTNFTKLDGQRLPAHVRERLEDGARLDFGRVAMIFRRG